MDTEDTVFALENSVYSVAIRAKKKKKYESNAEIGTGTWGWSQRTDIQPMVQALPQRARQDGLEAPNEADAA